MDKYIVEHALAIWIWYLGVSSSPDDDLNKFISEIINTKVIMIKDILMKDQKYYEYYSEHSLEDTFKYWLKEN